MTSIAQAGNGRLQGSSEQDVLVFRGIPFAQPPVGPLRFRAPAPPGDWAGVRDATRAPNVAYQPSLPVDPSVQGPDADQGLMSLGGPMSEDCLYLNVWTPALVGRRPVMVWIHGGNFTMGSGTSFGADLGALVRAGDVVCVSMNYRLGALGFLYLNELLGDQVSANVGMLDQIAALRWVRDNIEAFGGDPDNVTIFGVSAGGFCVGTLLAMPEARGLFQRAIVQSGGAHNAHSPTVATRIAEGVLAELGLTPDTAERILDKPPTELLRAQEAYYNLTTALTRPGPYRDADTPPGVNWAPAYQPVIDGRHLPQRPIDAVRAGSAADVTLIAGCTLEEQKLAEMLDPLAPKDDVSLARYIELIVPGVYSAGLSRGRRLAEYYRALAGAAATSQSIYSVIETDRIFRVPTVALLDAQSRHQQRTFGYIFARPSPLPGVGASHGIDIPYVFGSIGTPAAGGMAGSTDDDFELARIVQSYWLVFARAGDPNSAGSPSWPAYGVANPATMVLDGVCAVVENHLIERNRAWRTIL
jgi:para-nitrobenzyl esterase